MMLVIGVYTAPVISKAGDTFGVAFSVDGQEKYTERQNKTPLLLSIWNVQIKILMAHITMLVYMLSMQPEPYRCFSWL